ncbi:MAG: glycosyltransferase family 2 protein [Patescibacteria group bacterium]
MDTRITVVVPVFNEAGNVEMLYGRIGEVFANLTGYDYQVLFVDDGSTDESRSVIKAMADAGAQVSCIELSRNFGKEAALSAGIANADGEAVVLMDADLQHPPALIPALIQEWEKGADVVIGVRKRNPDEGAFRKLSSRTFSYLMRVMSDVPSVSGATDYRLLDRRVVDEFKRFTEHGRMTRGLIDWLGFHRAYVSFDADKRHTGTARYGYRKLIALGFSALVSHSKIPLRVAAYLGIPITIFAGSLGLFIIIEQLLLGDPLAVDVSPIGMIAVMILFLNGLVLICLGLTSFYIEKIHQDTVNRPLFVVKRERA